ncbi:TerB family tellurite resistance protein [Candidatus Latescibacterota bacterium]
MSEDYTVFHAKVLALSAWADGEFDAKEERLYLAIIEASTPSEKLKAELMNYIDNQPDLNDMLEEIPQLPKRTVAEALKNAFLISMADHDLCEKEKFVINSIAKKIGVRDDQLPSIYEMLTKYHESYTIEEELFYD